MSNEHEWLNLVEVSGPFLAVPVLREVFPQGLQALTSKRPQRLRRAYEEWRDAVDLHDADLSALHVAWIDEVLTGALEFSSEVLKRGALIPTRLKIALPEHGITLQPDLALVNPTQAEEPLLLIHVLAPDADLEATQRFEGLVTTPADRMVTLLRAAGCPMGLVTNGERWMLVHAPVGSVAGFTSWYARIWGQEPETLRAFVSLLGVRRFFGPDAEKLPALYERSQKFQDDVTDALGEQVRRAVEVLVQALDRADQDRNRDLLHDVDPRELYDAGLTVMMRLVFLLAAEERGLLLLGDPRYDAYYAISSLRMQLRADSEEVLERRRSAWSRLLALFRSVYGGIDHPTLRLPALGGSLFDPDRYPFLEGRKKGTSWRTHSAEPLPIDDRTVLLLLEAIQTFEGRTLSYRALDVEQIGHVYEGLLERTVKRVDDITLELESGAKAKNPRVTLGEMDSVRLDGPARVAELLKERSERSDTAIRNGLARDPDERLGARLLTVCRGDPSLRDRIVPYAHLLRTDPWGYPLVHHAGAFVVVLGTDRRESGTHYTPKSLTEKIVEETLVPVVYRGPAEGRPREEWELKSAEEILDLKVCDPAMGSGAFLVQACRWISGRLVESWASEESRGNRVDDAGRVHRSGDTGAIDLLSPESEERAILARRLVAERCLYGVDKNPLAVELAKLSLWLTTLAKGRPFGFLDHNLRSGDSLLGIRDLAQMIELDMSPQSATQPKLFGRSIRDVVDRAVALRERLREIPIRDIRDVEAMGALDSQSRSELKLPELIADALLGIVLSETRAQERKALLQTLAGIADRAVNGSSDAQNEISSRANQGLASASSDGRPLATFHWPLEFPEVFAASNPGFDAVIGNPPFLGGKKITSALGHKYRNYIVEHVSDGRRGNGDLATYFMLRYCSLLGENGVTGQISTKTISQGETRVIGLGHITNNGIKIIRAIKSMKWPGAANLAVAVIWLKRGDWSGNYSLDGEPCPGIAPDLTASDGFMGEPFRLKSNMGKSFQGSNVRGMGFVVTPELAEALISEDAVNSKVIFPYLGGDDILSKPDRKPSRFAINFFDWSMEQAKRFPVCFEIVERLVLPERLKIKDKRKRDLLSKLFWQYDSQAKQLYTSIANVTRYMVHPLTSKHHVFEFFEPGIVLAHTTTSVVMAGWADFAILQSQIHWEWALQYGNKLETRPQYTPSQCFDTFPFPSGDRAELTASGEHLYCLRNAILIEQNINLRELYNRTDDQSVASDRVKQFREAVASNDTILLHAYGWGDISLEHGFYTRNTGAYFGISPAAREELLQRLLRLNHEYQAAEKIAPVTGTARKGSSPSSNPVGSVGRPPEPSLWSESAPEDDGQRG